MKVEEIKKAVRLLPNGYRTVLSLYLFEGYDQEEIAEILKVTHATVRTQYMRAKQKLLGILKEGGLS
jgi:RNA polymerase sigma-70 factor (ECF subfamily)